ncbi:MAG: T9SS type A sorting domain-containing protein [Muribaculaceae bacterium]|nr:T9SS type A sorting domain-containing protein [Muribaculaceae bacterium]
MILVAVLICIPGCGMSDPETEKKLEGTWTYSTTEVEDCIEMTMTAIEKYSLSDHRFETTLTLEVGHPVNETMATIKYRGEWYATKESIVNEVDKGSVTFKFNKDLLDSSDRREIKDEILDELKKNDYVEGVRIVSPIGDTFEAVDDDGEEYTYTRLNSGGNAGSVALVSVAPSARVSPRAPRKGENVSVSIDLELVGKDCIVNVVSSSGQTVLETRMPEGESHLNINTSRFSKGVYVVTVSAEAVSKEVAKIIIR